jgi:radical SAM protein with 4Fe4S-binding SPASM domain
MTSPVLANIPGLAKGIGFRVAFAAELPEHPTFMILQTTVACNSRCRMCSIWKMVPENEMSLEEIEKVFKDPYMKKLRWLNLTGGEPFMRQNFAEIVKAAADNLPNLEIIAIPSNGFMPDRVEKITRQMLEYLKGKNILLNVNISIDGIGEKHEEIRRIPGGYQKVLDSLARLQAIGKENPQLESGVEAIITALNVGQMRGIYEGLKDKTDHVNLTPAIISSYYLGNEQMASDVKMKAPDIQEMLVFLKEMEEKEPAYAYYFNNVRSIYMHGHRTFPCLMGWKSMYMNASGDVFPCHLLGPDYKMGNIRDGSMTEIWQGAKAKEIRHRLKNEKFCDVCTNNCDLLNNLKEETWSFASYMLQHPQTFSRLLKEIREKDHLKKYAGGRVRPRGARETPPAA